MHSFLEAGLATNKRSSRTEPECIVAGLLDALGVAYERTVRVRQFTVDLLVGSTVIECYGDYWHCNPTLYGASYYNASLHMTACAKWAKDLARQRAIEALGYRVLVFWEQDIRSVPAAVKRALRAEFVSA